MGYDDFRRQLAGLADPQRRATETEKVAVKESAIRFISVLAQLFGDTLDRLTLWGKIGSALEAAHAKVSDDDLDRFADLCLEHVQADPGHAAACDALSQLRGEWAVWPPETRHAFLGYIGSHKYAVLTHGRARWERVKRKECDL